jgi:hypothetical protein
VCSGFLLAPGVNRISTWHVFFLPGFAATNPTPRYDYQLATCSAHMTVKTVFIGLPSNSPYFSIQNLWNNKLELNPDTAKHKLAYFLAWVYLDNLFPRCVFGFDNSDAINRCV